MLNVVLELIQKLFSLRNCNLKLEEEAIAKHKFKVCLEYHIGNCKGPCVGLQSEKDYLNTITQIKSIVKGNIGGVIKEMKAMMLGHADALEFEQAQALKEKIELLERYKSKSTVVSPSIEQVDVFSIVSDDQSACINYLLVVNGAIIQGHTVEIKKKLDETDEDLLLLTIAELRERFKSNSPEIIVPFMPSLTFADTAYCVPVKGDKKKLLELSERNVVYFKKEKDRQELLVDPERHTKRIMQQMMIDLRLKEEPRHIECFDNSNFQGAYAVSAMTVFKNGKASKNDYRHFTIKTVDGPDDFASMEEVIERRYKRAIDENQALPQLIVIDGGKGQLNAALKSLTKLGLVGKMGIIGIAKRLEEIFYPGDPIPMYLDKRSETLKILTQIRDEAHRFGITHYRKKHEAGLIKTELTEIKGISDKTAEKLLLHFKSVQGVKSASLSELVEVIGNAKALAVRNFYTESSVHKAT